MNAPIPGLNIPAKDVCHYYIYLKDASATRAAEVQAALTDIHEPWTRDYIWQDEDFAVTINPGKHSCSPALVWTGFPGTYN